jgi:glycosyltransferase involved in cell wall biosynthesis
VGKPKILVVGDPLYSVTGLAYVAGYISKIFLNSEQFESVAYFSLTGNVTDASLEIKAIDNGTEELKDIITYPTNVDTIAEDFDKVIKDYKPHIVFSITDPWMTEPLAHCQYKSSYFWIAYTTVEVPKYGNKIFNPSVVFQNQPYKNILENLVEADLVISVTKQGIESLKNIRSSTTSTGIIKLDNIYSENIYNGLEIDKRVGSEFKKSQILNGMCEDDDFIFMTLGVNSERKKLEMSIITFAKFLKKIDNPKKYKLYLHTNASYSLGGPDLIEVAANEGVLSQVIGCNAFTNTSKKDIYKFYAISDIYMAFPGGEGFSYGFAEAMLHSKPIVYIDYGGHSEYLKEANAGLPVKVLTYQYAMRMGIKWGLVDSDHAADQLVKLVKNKHLQKELGDNGFEYVKKTFDWKIIGEKLLKAIFTTYENSNFKVLYGKEVKRII